MRLVMFRGKSEKDDKWDWGDLVRNGLDYYIVDERDNTRCKVKGYTVGQFTGLYDSCTEPIYEGDVVETASAKYIVKFDKGGFFPFSCMGCDHNVRPEDCTVLGDIWDAELMKSLSRKS